MRNSTVQWARETVLFGNRRHLKASVIDIYAYIGDGLKPSPNVMKEDDSKLSCKVNIEDEPKPSSKSNRRCW